MKSPEIVINCVKKMREVGIKVTIKCRLGVDEFDSYEFAKEFVKKVHEEGGIQHFIIHARKAILKGKYLN
jgi:tRNA-dihydrouridine synthase A